MCCSVFPLPVLDKPAGAWCRHAGPAGCGVHGEGQPEVCRQYACYWLEHEDQPEECRPDLVGLVATEGGAVTVGGRDLAVLVITLSEADSDRGPAARAMLDEFLGRGMALLLLHGPDMRIEFDRTRYAGIEPGDIEEAFRRERSKDVEELRRLGAVEEGTRFP